MDIRQDDNQSPVLGQLEERTLEGGAQLGIEGAVLGTGPGVRWIEGGRVLVWTAGIEGVRGTAALPAQLITASIGDDAEEPRPETVAAKGANRAIGAEKGLLRRIFGGGALTHEAEREAIDLVLVGENEAIEGVQIAGLRTTDELGRIHSRAGSQNLRQEGARIAAP